MEFHKSFFSKNISENETNTNLTLETTNSTKTKIQSGKINQDHEIMIIIFGLIFLAIIILIILIIRKRKMMIHNNKISDNFEETIDVFFPVKNYDNLMATYQIMEIDECTICLQNFVRNDICRQLYCFHNL